MPVNAGSRTTDPSKEPDPENSKEPDPEKWQVDVAYRIG